MQVTFAARRRTHHARDVSRYGRLFGDDDDAAAKAQTSLPRMDEWPDRERAQKEKVNALSILELNQGK